MTTWYDPNNPEMSKAYVVELYKAFTTQLFMDFFAIFVYVGDFTDHRPNHTRLVITHSSRHSKDFKIQTRNDYVPNSFFDAKMKALELAINTIKEFQKSIEEDDTSTIIR